MSTADEPKPSTSTATDPNEDGESSFSEISEDESEYPESLCVESVADITDDYQNELELDLKDDEMLKKRKVIKKSPKLQSKIPGHLRGLIGEANLRFARGDSALAEKMCLELIRQAAFAYEPYVTLSQIYEVSHPERSLQYATMAAHLNPSNSEHWIRLYNMHMDAKNLKQAVTCLTKALMSDNHNIKLHLKRIKLLEILEDDKYLRRCKVRLLSAYSRCEYEKIIVSAKELAEEYHKDKNYGKAIEVMSVPFKKCPKHVTPELVNIYLQLLLISEKYLECLDVFVQFCNVEIELLIQEDQKVNILSYTMPANIAIDLRIKVVICMIKLGASHLISGIIDPLLEDENNVEKIGDLYFDVAEALISMEQHELALKLLVPLVKSKNFSLAAIWLKYADCLKQLNLAEQAIDAYNKVVKLAPQHTEVRYPLSELLLQKGDVPGAIEALTQSPDSCELDVGLLVKKLQLLKDMEDYKEYFICAEELIVRHSVKFVHYDELRISTILLNDKFYSKTERLNQLRAMHNTPLHKNEVTNLNEPGLEEEYILLKEILTLCWQRKEYATFQKLAFMGMCSPRYKSGIDELIIIGFYAALFNNDRYHAYKIIRESVLKNKESNILWNMFNLYAQRLEDLRYSRFLYRCAKGTVGSYPAARLLEASNALTQGSAKLAVLQLLPFLRMATPSTLVRLLAAVAFAQLSGRPPINVPKVVRTSHALITLYAQQRGKGAEQEVFYNMGRWYHQKGIIHIAAHYYKLALKTIPAIAKEHPSIDLTKEAAYNLMLIHKNSGDNIGATNIIITYLSI